MSEFKISKSIYLFHFYPAVLDFSVLSIPLFIYFFTFPKELLPYEELLRYQYACINLVLTLSNKVDISTNFNNWNDIFLNAVVCLKNVRWVKEINLKSWEQNVKILLSHWGKFYKRVHLFIVPGILCIIALCFPSAICVWIKVLPSLHSTSFLLLELGFEL